MIEATPRGDVAQGSDSGMHRAILEHRYRSADDERARRRRFGAMAITRFGTFDRTIMACRSTAGSDVRPTRARAAADYLPDSNNRSIMVG